MTESAVIIPLRANRAPGQRWQPFIGEEAMRLMAYKGLPGPAAADIQQAAARILGFGQDPSGDDGQRTGLVVGYVQSGKTLSFTTVIALARDNNIPIVVVVAGTSVPLFGQTVDRLLEDLQIDRFDGPPRWLHVRNPDLGSRQTVQNAIAAWRNPDIQQSEKPTLLLTVMKHHTRLDSLNDLLAGLNLVGVPALIIDDEADQASLNNYVNQGRASTTYEQLLSLIDRLPHHTFLQYPAETVRLYKMRPDYPAAQRGVDTSGRMGSIRRLLQGPTRSGGGYSYPGDLAFRDEDRVTVQLHTINLTEKQDNQDVIVARSVPTIAIWVPQRMSLDWITQDQQGRAAN